MRSRHGGILFALLAFGVPAIASDACEEDAGAEALSEAEPCGEDAPPAGFFSASLGVGHANAGIGLQLSANLGQLSMFASLGTIPRLTLGESWLPYGNFGLFVGVGLRWWLEPGGGLFLSVHAAFLPLLFFGDRVGLSVLATTVGWRFRFGRAFADIAIGPAVSYKRFYTEMGIDDGYGFSALGGDEPFFPDFTVAVGFEL